MRMSAAQTAAYVCIYLLAGLFAGLVVLQFREAGTPSFAFAWHRRAQPASTPSDASSTSPAGSNGVDNTTPPWTFEYTRDGNNHGLSEEQCTAAFPLLTMEIDRAVEYRHNVAGNITLDDLEIKWRGHGILRILIHENQLYIVDTLNVGRGHRTRYLATLNSINAALRSYPGTLPTVEFTFTVQDNSLIGEGNSNRTVLAYARRAEEPSVWLMPDFVFWGWPQFGMPSYAADFRAVLDDSEMAFLDKKPQLVWRGSIDNNPARKKLAELSKDQPWSNVRGIDWLNKEDPTKNVISMEEHCDYMFTAMTEGMTWGGRLKLLLNCHSVMISHEMAWLEWYHHLLAPSGEAQNYILLEHFDGLRKTMRRLLEPAHRHEAQRIADNARRVFREQYLTPAAVSCYWRALFRGWASVQGFQPSPWMEPEVDPSRTGKLRRRPRGTSFEAYAIMESTEWEVPAQPRMLVNDPETYW
ncbi:glycosyl transferase family 90-domain-containing protein [Neohortaea acidophila]|uniref:Glycosyl transferase family 90-domain-containing protein n=1 Tax=Neohortaea acidophila TaxID=245834 RepID=A0A6A6PGA5_9PEZI|nr:glycosyl transferase family 90-domain-containing protein [Neohortaea acidophila]KAF2478764.1 glycosyl transferase family 90-domain-containing protein [Neohortaea acidophila]